MTKLPWLLFGFAIVGAVYLCVLLLNAGSALDDAWSEVARQQQRSDLALKIIRKHWLGEEQARVIALSAEQKEQGIIVWTADGSLGVGDLIFEIEQGIVSDVRYID